MILDYSRVFKKDYKKLSKKAQVQFRDRVELFQLDKFHPTLNNHSLHYPYEGCQSINISGDICAIYEKNTEVYTFIRIGTHSELYG